jgi:hypothetical protein
MKPQQTPEFWVILLAIDIVAALAIGTMLYRSRSAGDTVRRKTLTRSVVGLLGWAGICVARIKLGG